MNVYLVFRFIHHEGDDFYGAFDSLEKANNEAMRLWQCYDRPQEEIVTKPDGTIKAKFSYGYYFTTITEVQ